MILLDFLDCRFDGGLVGHVERRRNRVLADRLDGRIDRRRVAPVDQHARARRDVAFRDGAADAAAGAGDERKAPGEVEHGHWRSFDKAG